MAEVQPFQAGEVAELGGNGRQATGVVEGQQFQAGEVAELGGNGRQAGVVEVQRFQAGEVAQLRGDRTGQAGVGESQPFQAGEVAKFRGDRTGQAGAGEVQVFQAGEVAEFRGDRTGQVGLPAFEVQVLQPGEVAQLGRERAGQVVAWEDQPRRPVQRVRRHPVPIFQRIKRQPVRIPGPIRPGGGMIQSREAGAIGGRIGRELRRVRRQMQMRRGHLVGFAGNRGHNQIDHPTPTPQSLAAHRVLPPFGKVLVPGFLMDMGAGALATVAQVLRERSCLFPPGAGSYPPPLDGLLCSDR